MEIGAQVGNYRLDKLLGVGGMGQVYLSTHVFSGRLAAVKILKPEFCRSTEHLVRFLNEARACARVRHPNLVDIFEVGQTEGGVAFLMMEYLEGETLRAAITRRGSLPVPEALWVARQIATPMALAHAADVVHRDLKPDNIFLTRDADAPFGYRLKVLDFGIARLGGDATPGAFRTETFSVLGTPTYMSPEQCRGAGMSDHRSDIYSLGCILFSCLCGRPPFVGEWTGDVISGHMRDEPPSVADLVPGSPPALVALVGELLRKSPSERPQSMTAVVAGIDALATPPRLSVAASPAAKVVTPSVVAVEPSLLGAAAGEAIARSRPPRASFGYGLAACGVIAALVIGVQVARRSRAAPTVTQLNEAEIAPSVQPKQVAAPITPVVVVSAPVAPVVVAPSSVALTPASTTSVRIESQPPGAEVRRKSDDHLLGTAPVDVRVSPQELPLVLRLHLTGYADASLRLAGEDSDRYIVALHPAAARPTAKRPRTERKVLVGDPFAP